MNVDDGPVFFKEVVAHIPVVFACVLSVNQMNLCDPVGVVVGLEIANNVAQCIDFVILTRDAR